MANSPNRKIVKSLYLKIANVWTRPYAENTHRRGDCHCTTGLLFDWCGTYKYQQFILFCQIQYGDQLIFSTRVSVL